MFCVMSPFSSGLRESVRVWAGGQTSSHFQGKDGLRDVFFLFATTSPSKIAVGRPIFLPVREDLFQSCYRLQKRFRFGCFCSAGVADFAAELQGFLCISALRWDFQTETLEQNF